MLACLVWCVACDSASDQAAETYRYEKGGFSVEIPAGAEVNKRGGDDPLSEDQEYSSHKTWFVWEDKTADEIFAVLDIYETPAKTKLWSSLEDYVRLFHFEPGWETESRETIDLGGLQAIRSVCFMGDEDYWNRMHTLCFQKDENIYLLRYMISSMDDPKVVAFMEGWFSSFRWDR